VRREKGKVKREKGESSKQKVEQAASLFLSATWQVALQLEYNIILIFNFEFGTTNN